MINLDNIQKDAIGLTFVLNKLAPDSPYGVEKIKQLAPFGRDGKIPINERFDNIEKIINLTKSNTLQLDEIRRQLMQLKNIRGVVAKCETASLHEVELFEMKSFLLTFEKLFHAYQKANIHLAGVTLQPMEVALDLLDPEGKRLAPFAIDESYSLVLGEIRQKKLRLERKIQFETDPIGRDELMKERYHLVTDEVAEEGRVMGRLSEKLREHTQAFYDNMDNVGKLDFIIAKAMLALEYHAIRPEITDTPTVVFKNMFNPYVENALLERNEKFTKISITLTDGVTMITGANMGGKSVSIKTMVLNIALCQMGFFVFAEGAEIPLFDGVAFISGDLQDIEQGLSTFGAEITRLNEIVHRLRTDFLFVALDEFARGTNPDEGAAIVRAVASYMSDSGSVCVMTTHYDHVVSPKFRHYQVAGLSFTDIEKIRMQGFIGSKSIAKYMDYTLIEADINTPPPRDALNICRLIELDSEILDRIESEYE